ncbi:polysaccharide deacetylase family protein [Microbacterium sp. 1P10UB]|uniref:polysaccharide deacetylase family protein n=1 Tax=unclassified Microbacterium TaxID=2609290 RepID=UPI0039A29F78
MDTTRRRRRASRQIRRRRTFAAVGAIAVIAAIVTAIVVVPKLVAPATGEAVADGQPAPGAPSDSPTPTPTVALTAAQQLLAGSTDPAACAVTFTGDGISDQPVLQTEGGLYSDLPLPSADGRVFAGWYTTSQDAAAFTTAQRVNESRTVSCTDRETTLFASWKTPEENIAENARIPILMYHQFTTNPAGEEGWLRGNYAYIGDFDAHMAYIASDGFYLPTWRELGAFIDGKVFLPNHSVIVTDDDADQTWFDLAAPVVEKYKVMTTSFMITAWRQDAAPNPYVLRRSHTHDMHRAGDNGQGRMVNLSADEIAADLETSASVLGVKEVVAYPFGHYNDITKQGVAQAGFEMGRTIEPGYVSIGSDKLALPVQRVNYGMGLDALVGMIG